MDCIIIDDEPIAHHIIEDYVNEINDLEIVKSFYNAVDAISFLNTTKVDLIFLDIKMPKLEGLDFVKTLTNPPAIIITSAYEEYALKSYELSITDYLLKPFSFERFLKAYHKVSKAQPENTIQQSNIQSVSNEDTLFLKGDKEIHQVKIEHIKYLESYGGYVKLYLTDEKPLVIHQALQYFESTLNSNFLRIHRSYIVNKKYIKSIVGNRIKLDDMNLPIGQSYKINVVNLIK
ncbi:response regulator [Flavobacteriaceae bacterium R38]|nr:response regulator [Flavobacteriaceae bacterium R38]